MCIRDSCSTPRTAGAGAEHLSAARAEQTTSAFSPTALFRVTKITKSCTTGAICHATRLLSGDSMYNVSGSLMLSEPGNLHDIASNEFQSTCKYSFILNVAAGCGRLFSNLGAI